MRKSCFLVLVLGIVLGASVQGAERTWDGSVLRDDDWSTAANWVGSIAPVAGDSLRFPPGAGQLSNSNDYAPGTIFNAITYSGAGYTTRGSRVALSNGVSVTYASGLTVMYPPITLRQDQTFTVSQAGATLLLNGDIGIGNNQLDFTGAGNITILGDIDNDRFGPGFRSTVRKSGTGQLLLLQHANYNCPTVVNGGSLRVDYSLSNSLVTVNSGGTLLGLGKVEALRVNSGGVMQPGAAVPDEFDVLRNVELNPGSIFRVRLNGTNAGSNYDQLRVGGDITLSGTLEVIAGFTPAIGDEFTIIKNEGTNDIAGIFAGLPEGAEFFVNGRPYRISYGGRFGGGIGGGGFGRNSDVTLTAIPKHSLWDAGGGFNNLWSQPVNWTEDLAPLPGDDIEFNNASASVTLLTTNDYPAGRLFGSLFIGRNKHRIIGNMAQFDGRVEVTAPGQFDIEIPLILKGGFRNQTNGNFTFHQPITLSGSQIFLLTAATADLDVKSLALNGYNLTVDTATQPDSFGSARTTFSGVAGPGTLKKEGPGALAFFGSNSCSTVVNEGTLIAGGTHAGLLTVNTGALLQTSGRFGDLEVNGGTFQPGPAGLPSALGEVRLVNDATLKIRLYSASNGEGQSYGTNTGFQAASGHPVVLSNCNLALDVASSGNSDRVYLIIEGNHNTGIIGTFNGLPEGATFVTGGRGFSISYNLDLPLSYPGVVLRSNPDFVWDGGAPDANCTSAGNWSYDTAPVAECSMRFPSGVLKRSVSNDYPTNVFFREVYFDGSGYTFSGNRLNLRRGLACTFNSGEATVHADINLPATNIFVFDVAGSGRLRLTGKVSGRGAKSGPGTLRLEGTIANTLNLEVTDGNVELEKGGTNAVSGLTIKGGQVNLLDDNQINNFAQVQVIAPGRLELNGNNELIGNLSGDGTIELSERFGRGGRLSVNSGDFAGTIQGLGGVTKTGGAVLTLRNLNTFSGTTIVQQGELRVDGYFTNSPIRLDGGTLSGRGYVATITAGLGGTLTPGFGGPQFESALHSRDVSLNPATIFRPTLTSSNPDFEGHKLAVAGSVNLGNSTLDIKLYAGFLPTNNASFVIIENDGNDAIAGTFSGIPEGAMVTGGTAFRISYRGGSGNDVVLTRVQVPPSSFNRVTRIDEYWLEVEGMGLPGVQYNIQTTTNLNPVIQWLPYTSAIANSNGVFRYQFSKFGFFSEPLPQRFFRAVTP